MKNIIWGIAGIALIVIIIILSGKNNSAAPTPSNLNPDGMETSGLMPRLTSNVWVWQKTAYEDGSSMTPNHPGAFTVQFMTDGTVTGTTDCNDWGSKFTLGEDGTIRLESIVSTLKFCEYSEESPYFSSIGGADKINFAENGDLLLTIEIDNVGPIATMTFSSADAPSESGDWNSTTSGGKTFKYPASLGTKYISLTDWPPVLNITNEAFSCFQAGAEIERAGETKTEVINGHTYCVTRVSEGAAGSMYTQYAYARAAGSKTEILIFTLRFVQCGNYNEPEMSKCQSERNAFDIGPAVDKIFQTVK